MRKPPAYLWFSTEIDEIQKMAAAIQRTLAAAMESAHQLRLAQIAMP
jgi:hypothetical protein